MKNLKNFNQLIKEDVNLNESHGLKDTFYNIFKIFQTKDALTEIWDEDTLQVSTDVYDVFIDAKELMVLSKEELQDFADNLGVGGEDDILMAILKKMYEEKFKRTLKDDIDMCIETLKDFIQERKNSQKLVNLSNRYLTELEKIKNYL